MTSASRPLKGHSILVIDDDRLGAYRVHRALVAAGARVASGDLSIAEPYLGAAALAAVVVGTGLNGPDAQRLGPLPSECAAPWVAYGADTLHPHLPAPAARVPANAPELLVTQISGLLAGPRH